jgi:hypothetical protein
MPLCSHNYVVYIEVSLQECGRPNAAQTSQNKALPCSEGRRSEPSGSPIAILTHECRQCDTLQFFPVAGSPQLSALFTFQYMEKSKCLQSQK